MITPQALVFLLIGVSILLILIFMLRPSVAVTREGRALALVAFFILPVLAASIGAAEHLEHSKQTEFCLSCHIMEPFGKSLYVDDSSWVPAAHFQNHWILPGDACYTCHTDYGMYGDLRAKWEGLGHVYANYFGHPMKPLRLYHPYRNRECLHCHLGARSFESSPLHLAIREDLKDNKVSCISSGCHDTIHNVEKLNQVKFWTHAEH